MKSHSRHACEETSRCPQHKTEPDQLAALRESFMVASETTRHVITCKACGAKWSLATRAGGVNGANILHLLNHAAGCR